MNTDGGMNPRAGWFQRSSASTPTMRAAVGLHDRLVVNVEGARRERARHLALDEPPLLELRFHLGREGDHAAAAAPLGGPQREIGAPRELVAGRAVARRDAQARCWR